MMRTFVRIVSIMIGVVACRGEEARLAGTAAALSGDAWTIGQPTRLTSEGYYLAPRFSPDGRYLLFAGPKYQGLFATEVGRPDSLVTISDEDYVGWAARWTVKGIETRTRDGRVVVFRDPFGARERVETGQTYDPKAPNGPIHAYHEDDAIHLILRGQDRVISDGQDRYFAPLVSPDGQYVVYEGLVSGLYLYEVSSGRTVAVGRGNHPAWLPDSSGFLYDVTEDDGVRLTAGEVWAYVLALGRSVRLTNTSDLIETHPVASPDGRLVAFESEGGIFVAPLLRTR